MATVYLVPNFAINDANSNVSAGAYTDVDEGIIGGTPSDSDVVTTVVDQFTGGAGGGAWFSFPITNAPGDFGTFTSARLRVRGTVQSGDDDTNVITCSITGTNAPTSTVTFQVGDTNNSFTTKVGALDSTPSPSSSDIDGWVVKVEQTSYTKNRGFDGAYFDLSAIEVELNYTPGTKDADGDADLASPTASGEAIQILDVTGDADLTQPTASGTGKRILGCFGAALLATAACSGTADLVVAADGDADLESPTASGSVTRVLNVSDAVTLDENTASGQVDLIVTADGNANLTGPTASSSVTQVYKPSGAADLASPTSAGIASLGPVEATGDADLTGPTSAASVTQTYQPTGAADLAEILASGTVVKGVLLANGDADLAEASASGTITYVHQVTSAADLDEATASGTSEQILQPSGNADLETIVASGTVIKGTGKTANGDGTLETFTASGAASRGPRVYLNDSETTVGATLMNVTGWNQAGTSITFSDPEGDPTGNLFLGVVRDSDGQEAWIAVTVADVRLATGDADLASPTASATATAETIVLANGDADLAQPTASGSAFRTLSATGDATLAEATADGTGLRIPHKFANGDADLAQILASGSATVRIDADGNANLEIITADGTAGILFLTADGDGALEVFTASGTAEAAGPDKVATGDADMTAVTAVASVVQTKKPSGNATLAEVLSSADVDLVKDAIGGALQEAAVVDGTAARIFDPKDVTGDANAEAITSSASVVQEQHVTSNAQIAEITAAANASATGIRTAIGDATLAEITANGQLGDDIHGWGRVIIRNINRGNIKRNLV